MATAEDCSPSAGRKSTPLPAAAPQARSLTAQQCMGFAGACRPLRVVSPPSCQITTSTSNYSTGTHSSSRKAIRRICTSPVAVTSMYRSDPTTSSGRSCLRSSDDVTFAGHDSDDASQRAVGSGSTTDAHVTIALATSGGSAASNSSKHQLYAIPQHLDPSYPVESPMKTASVPRDTSSVQRGQTQLCGLLGAGRRFNLHDPLRLGQLRSKVQALFHKGTARAAGCLRPRQPQGQVSPAGAPGGTCKQESARCSNSRRREQKGGPAASAAGSVRPVVGQAATARAAADKQQTPAAVDEASIASQLGSTGGERQASELTVAFTLDADQWFEAGTFINKGGQGEVRRVEVMGRAYALKREEYLSSEVSLSRIIKSPLVMMPLIVTRVAEYNYSLYPLAAGDLQQALNGIRQAAAASDGTCVNQGCMPFEAVRPSLAQIVSAVGELHDKHIQHRDIKPSNLLITPDNKLCLADCALATSASKSALGCGTEGFMAPEQWCATEKIFERRARWEDIQDRLGLRRNNCPVDIWASAVTTLCLVFPLDVVAGMVESAMKWRLRPRVPAAAACLPADLSDLLFKRMLVRAPGQRYTISQIKQHPYFAGVDWAAVPKQRVAMPIDLVAMADLGRQE